jgi:TolB-like protein
VERSIAVLPLTNASGDPSQQFFSDGLSENLIATLSRFDGLKVIGRTSAFQFRDSKQDSRTMGQKLGVAYLLDGSMQRAEGIVRISARLTRADDGSTVWAEHYDRPYRDLFALQDEIAQAVADALHARLVSAQDAARQGDRPPSGSIEAYNAYLRGLQRFYAQDFEGSVAQQQEATRLDPGYAAAWAQLSIASALIGQDQTDRGKAQAAFRTSRAAVDRALTLAPDLGIAHGALGNLLFASDIRWTDALAELQRGVALAPDNGQMQGGLSRVLAANGRLRDAIAHRERFLSIEPLAPFNYGLYADLLVAAGRLDEAEENLRIGQQLARSPVPHYRLLYVAVLRGDAKTAMAVARRQAPRWRDVNVALAAQVGLDRAAADAALERVLADARKDAGAPYQIAQVYALRGDVAHTVAWLERTWDARDISIHQLLYDPLILRFRRDPALIAFCAKVGLPPPGDSEAMSIDQIRAALVATR